MKQNRSPLISYLVAVFRNQFDDRFPIVRDPTTFSGVIETIPERYTNDAVKIICMALIATVENPKLLSLSHSADILLYVLGRSENGIPDPQVFEILGIIGAGGREGVIAWLSWVRSQDFRRDCPDDLDIAIKLWEGLPIE